MCCACRLPHSCVYLGLTQRAMHAHACDAGACSYVIPGTNLTTGGPRQPIPGGWPAAAMREQIALLNSSGGVRPEQACQHPRHHTHPSVNLCQPLKTLEIIPAGGVLWCWPQAAGFIGQAAGQFGGWADRLVASGVPRSMRLWVTEYNLQNIRPVAAYETWAHGMLVSARPHQTMTMA
jgi:hypothetical protein